MIIWCKIQVIINLLLLLTYKRIMYKNNLDNFVDTVSNIKKGHTNRWLCIITNIESRLHLSPLLPKKIVINPFRRDRIFFYNLKSKPSIKNVILMPGILFSFQN